VRLLAKENLATRGIDPKPPSVSWPGGENHFLMRWPCWLAAVSIPWLTAAYKSVATDASIGISFGVDAGVWRNAPSGA
jgi:hypothetical protein